MKPLIHYGGFAHAGVSRFESQTHRDLEARIQHRHGHAAEDECRPGCIYVESEPTDSVEASAPEIAGTEFSGTDA